MVETAIEVDGEAIRYDLIPVPYMAAGMRRYLEQHIAPGHFLTALLSNDLRGCFERGDEHNIAALQAWLRWLYQYAPGGSWGSADRLREWV